MPENAMTEASSAPRARSMPSDSASGTMLKVRTMINVMIRAATSDSAQKTGCFRICPTVTDSS